MIIVDKIMNYIKSSGFWGSVIAIVIGLILYLIIKRIVNKYFQDETRRISKKKITYYRLFKNLVKYIIILIIIVVILELNGVNIKTLLAGIGIISVIAGLALQDFLKDVIMGFNLITDDYFFVGDVIKIGNIQGKVLAIGLKNTKIKDVNNGEVYIVANRNITDALISSDLLGITIPLPYEEKLDRVEEVIDSILKELLKLDHVEKVEYRGIDEFSSSSIDYRLVLFVKPEYQLATKRKANRIIKKMLDDEGISIPFTQIDIHNIK